MVYRQVDLLLEGPRGPPHLSAGNILVRDSYRTRMERTDVAIVGASLAGLAAALAAAREGAAVTLLEAKREIGVPPGPAITAHDKWWPEGIPQPEHTVARRLAGSKLRASDGRGPLVDGALTLLDRQRFDQFLAEEAQKAGAEILTGVTGLDARPDLSLVTEGLEVKPKVLIFADGVRTQAARFLKPTRDPQALQWGAVLTFRAPEPPSDGRYYITLGEHAPGGRSQLNPLGGDRWSHWTFFRHRNGHEAEDVARAAFAVDARLMGWEDVAATFAGVGPDPLYTIPGELARGQVMVAGGAAGQGGVEVGLASGQMAGTTAARAVRGEARLEDYERDWKKKYQRSYERLRNSNDGLMRLSDAEVRSVVGAWEGHRVGGRPSPGLILRNPRGVLALLKAIRLAKRRGRQSAQPVAST